MVRETGEREWMNGDRILVNSKRPFPHVVFPSTDFSFNGLFAPGLETHFSPGVIILISENPIENWIGFHSSSIMLSFCREGEEA